jgi:pre-mRNA-splicing helicase BRR2
VQADLTSIANADIIICTPEKWDFISRKWRQRKQVLQVSLYIFDSIHLINEGHAGSGVAYEIVMSRVRSIQAELENNKEDYADDESIQTKQRIVALSSPLANAKDVADWLGISFPDCTFNFHPSVRAQCPSIGALQVQI